MFNNAMMKQAKKMQEKMKEAQEEIAKMETEGSSGGISIKMIGGKTIEEVTVSENIFEISNIFGFLAIILAAVNIFGGFLVTQRMLQMYKKKKKK